MEELANMEEELVVYLQDIASRVPSLKFVFCGYPRSATYLSSWEIRETAHGSTIALLEETAALRLIETSWKLTESGVCPSSSHQTQPTHSWIFQSASD